MATISDMIENWRLEEIRWASQVNDKVWLAWFNKWLLIFQKTILEYVSGKQNLSNAVYPIIAWQSEYELPLWEVDVPDFYSIIQLRVAYDEKNWVPKYRVCKQINLTDYNINPSNWKQIGEPIIWDRINKDNPRFTFVDKEHIKIYPTPDKNVANWLALSYNYIKRTLTEDEAFWIWDEDHDRWETEPVDLDTLNLPRYFFDAIEDYITFRLYQAENPEQAQWYYQQFEQTLHDNIYGLNKDKRPVEESLADTSYFSHY